MSFETAWFLVAFAGLQHLGPMSQHSCQEAAAILGGEGIVCRQPVAMMACAVPDQPGIVTSCPVFDFPKVTVRP